MEKNVAKGGVRFNRRVVIVTIDIGKGKNMGYCRTAEGLELKPFEFENNRQGFERLWDQIVDFKQAHNCEGIVVGIESTGIYGQPLVHFLREKPVKLVQVNVKHTKRLKEMQDNTPNKTDKKDTKVIADIIELGRYLNVVTPEGAAAELRSMAQARERAIDRMMRMYNQLHGVLFVIFPEFTEVLKDLRVKTARYLLEHYPRPEDVAKCDLDKFVEVVREVSHKAINRKKAERLWMAARESVGVKEGVEGMVLEMRRLLEGIDKENRFITKLEGMMAKYLEKIPYSKYLLSTGIGKNIVASLIGEVCDFRAFKTSKELLKYAGLNLFEISSGRHKGKKRISKIGRRLMRQLLYFAALNAVRKNGIMREEFKHYRDNGMPGVKALVAISRKLLRIMFALVKNETMFIKGYVNSGVQGLSQAA